MTNDRMKKSIKNLISHRATSEKNIEKYLTKRVEESGGICLKYSNASMTGYPDRVVLLPGGKTLWIELKSKGEKPTPLQIIRHKMMGNIGHQVYVADSHESIDKILGEHEL